MEEVPGSQKFFPAQLVFLALGFLGPQVEVIKALGVKQDARLNIQTPNKVSLAAGQTFIVSDFFSVPEIQHQCGGYIRGWRLPARPVPHCLGNQVSFVKLVRLHG